MYFAPGQIPQLKQEEIGDVVVGCSQPQDAQGLNVGRMIIQRAGLPDSVTAQTVNRFCSSGLQAMATCANAILSGQEDIRDQSVVIVGSGMTGLETAEYLADRNNYVTLIEMDDRIARAAYGIQIADVMKQLETHNVVTMVSTALNSIEEGYITVKNTLTEEITCIPADVVVLSLGVRSSKPFGDKLSKICEHVYTIGDAKKSGRIYDAVSSGYEAGITI